MSMTRSICSRPSMRSQGAASTRAPFSRAAVWPNSVSTMSVDLPEPETPVTQVNRPRGICVGTAEQAQRDLRGQLREVVAARADDADLPARIRADAQPGHCDTASAREVLAGDRSGVGGDVARCALRHQMTAVRTGARPQVHDVVGLADRLLVVLDNDHRVAEVAQLLERRQQAPVVALVQPDRGLIEDVHDSGEPRSDLAGKPNALRFPA